MIARPFTDPLRLYGDLVRAYLGNRARLAEAIAEGLVDVLLWWAL